MFSLWDPNGELPVVDLFAKYPLDFATLVRDSIEVDIGGVTARIASVEHLIEMKSRVGRDSDRHDINELQKRNER